MKKVGGKHIFPSIGKKYAYFPPNWLKTYKVAKNKAEILSPAARTPYNKFNLGKKYQSRKGGGAKYEF